jgi:hypothetical protein
MTCETGLIIGLHIKGEEQRGKEYSWDFFPLNILQAQIINEKSEGVLGTNRNQCISHHRE